MLAGGFKKRVQKEGLKEVADVVVGTPGRLAELLEEGALSLEHCRAIVLDEVDVLVGGAGMFDEQAWTPASTAFRCTASAFLDSEPRCCHSVLPCAVAVGKHAGVCCGKQHGLLWVVTAGGYAGGAVS